MTTYYSAVYDNAIVHFGIGEINWTAGQTDINALLGDATEPTKATDAHYAQAKYGVGHEINTATGYTLGGKATGTLVTAVLASNVVQFDSADTAWTSASLTAYYASVYHGTLADDASAMISYHQLGGAQTVTAGTLTLVWAATGVFTITVSAHV